MNDARGDDDLDRWLTSVLADDPLADAGFTTAVLHGINRRAQRRRTLLTIGWVAAAAAVFAGTPGVATSLAPVTPATLGAMMTLSALCSLVWMATTE